MISPLFCLILLPILGAIFAFANVAPRRVSQVSAVTTLLATLAVALSYGRNVANNPQGRGEYLFVSQWDVLPQWGLNFTLGVDGLAVVMLMLSALVLVGAVWFSPKEGDRPGLFYGNVLLIAAGAIGAFASVDVFFFFAFHELALIPTFLLIGIWGSGDRQGSAWKATVYLATGSFILLLGIIGLYLSAPENSRTFDMRYLSQLAVSGALQPGWVVYLLLVFGFGILVSLFPFHTWAPPAYASAPTPAAMLHAGVLKKFGLYGLMRLVAPLFPPGVTEPWSNLLIALIIGNILFVGFVTVAQKRLDWMLGNASVMHAGYMFLGIFSGTELGLNGAALLLLAHGLSIAVLFALAGEIRDRTGTLDLDQLGGLAKTAPAMGLFFGFGVMAAAGLPGFANFIGEVLVFFGSFARVNPDSLWPSHFQWAAIAAVWGMVISALYFLRAYRKIFFGEPLARWSSFRDLSLSARVPLVLLLAGLMLAGFYPHLVTSLLKF